MEGAIASTRRAIALQPHRHEFLSNLANPLKWLGRFEEAASLYRRTLSVYPGFATGLYNLGMIQLVLGDLAAGWANYEWRLRGKPAVRPRPFGLPFWRGPSQPGGMLLVWAEQGLGDELIHGSMLPDLVRHGVPAVVECDARMVSIFARSLPKLNFVAKRDPPDHRLSNPDITAQVPMGSLARWFRARLEDFPANAAYLIPRVDLVEYWRQRLAALGNAPKIGFAWRSRRIDGLARRFHPPVLKWSPVLRQRGVTFVSLQYGEADDDIRAVEDSLGTRIHRFSDLDLFNDLENTLALSAALDLGVATSATAAYFPLAAGLPMWVITPESDFWTFGTETYPWFSNIQLYRHPYARPWADTIGRLARDLAAHLGRR